MLLSKRLTSHLQLGLPSLHRVIEAVSPIEGVALHQSVLVACHDIRSDRVRVLLDNVGDLDIGVARRPTAQGSSSRRLQRG